MSETNARTGSEGPNTSVTSVTSATSVFDQESFTATLTDGDAGSTGAGASDPSTAIARPTVRWGALVWSLLFGALAATTLWVIVEPARRDAVGSAFANLSPLAAALYALLALGVLVVVFGLVALIRRSERARR
jgi:hypothetical protein